MAFTVCVVAGFLFILTDPGVKSYGIMVQHQDWSEAEAEAAAMAAQIPDGTVVGFTWPAMNTPQIRFFLDRPFVTVPNVGLRQIAERNRIVVVASADGTDPSVQTALDAGGKIVLQDDNYIVFAFDDPAAIPLQLDPDG